MKKSISDFQISPFLVLIWVASPSVTFINPYSSIRFVRKTSSLLGGQSGFYLSLWAFHSPPKWILSCPIISFHLAVCAGLPWLLTPSTCPSWSYTFTNLIFLPEGYFISNTCTSPSPPISTFENSTCVSLHIAVIIFPPLTSLYPGWLMLYPSLSTTGSCIITTSAPQTIPLSSAIITASYPLPQLCIMHFTIASWGFLGFLHYSSTRLSPVSKQHGLLPHIRSVAPQEPSSPLLPSMVPHPPFIAVSPADLSSHFGVPLPSPSRFALLLLLSLLPPVF